MKARTILASLAVAIVAAIVVSRAGFLWTPGLHTPITEPDDFRAFYCGGRATIRGADPYLTEPLRGCEHAAAAAFGLTVVPYKFVLPAPLPPYALAFFGALGALPFPIASTLWFAVLVASIVVASVVTTRLARVRPVSIVAALVVSGIVSIGEGQLAPLVTAALCCAALAARTGRFRLASVGLAFAMLEPHIGLPALVCACFDARLRRVVLVVAAVLFAIALVPGGASRVLEYVTQVLPAHASSEVDWYTQQFSLTSMLWSFGASRAFAQACGAFDYIAMAALGIWTALRLRARYDDRAFLVLVPPAFAALGGSFIHIFQIETAVPLALVCLGVMKRPRLVLAFALVGLAIPTQYLVNESALSGVFDLPLQIRVHPSKPWSVEATQLAERTEMDHTGAMRTARPDTRTALLALVPKLPTWIALAMLVCACVLKVRRLRPDESSVSASALVRRSCA